MRNLEKDEIEMTARRKAMLEEGFRLFAQKGIEPVSMQEIAKASNVGIATLYRYYATKLALVLEIGTGKWQEYGKYIRDLRKKNRKQLTAAQELESALNYFIELYQDHKDLLRFNQEFNNYVQHAGATEEQLRPYLNSIGEIKDGFCGIYEKGKKDGTIRTDLPAEKMFAITIHLMLAVGVRFAQGVLYSADNEADRVEEYELLKRMLLQEYVIG